RSSRSDLSSPSATVHWVHRVRTVASPIDADPCLALDRGATECGESCCAAGPCPLAPVALVTSSRPSLDSGVVSPQRAAPTRSRCVAGCGAVADSVLQLPPARPADTALATDTPSDARCRIADTTHRTASPAVPPLTRTSHVVPGHPSSSKASTTLRRSLRSRRSVKDVLGHFVKDVMRLDTKPAKAGQPFCS